MLRVSKWREIVHGVWLPQRAESVLYDAFTEEKDGRGPPVEVSRGTYLLDTAQLDPQYDDNFFEDVDMPNVVHVVESGKSVPAKDPAAAAKDK